MGQRVIKRWVWLSVFLMTPILSGRVEAVELAMEVTVADPYAELRTGPGRGYPVFYVEERGQQLTILKRRTDWYKVQLKNGTTGWVSGEQIGNTLTEAGVGKTLRDSVVEDFFDKKWELGFMWGTHGTSPYFSIIGARKTSDTLSLELSYGEVSAKFSNRKLIDVAVVSHPFVGWRYQPYFALGLGKLIDTPLRTQVDAPVENNYTGHVAVGVKAYLTKNFTVRAYYKRYSWYYDDTSNFVKHDFAFGASFFF